MISRVARWAKGGLEYEADPRQIECLIKSQGLDDSCKTMMTIWLKPTKEQMAEERLLEGKLQSPYRADGARYNDVGPDKPDVKYTAKETCRWMSAPSDVGLAALSGLCDSS